MTRRTLAGNCGGNAESGREGSRVKSRAAVFERQLAMHASGKLRRQRPRNSVPTPAAKRAQEMTASLRLQQRPFNFRARFIVTRSRSVRRISESDITITWSKRHRD